MKKIGLTRKEIYSRLFNDPDDKIVHSLYKIEWRNGLKPHRESVSITNDDNVSLKKRKDIIPRTIEFDLTVKMPIYTMMIEDRIYRKYNDEPLPVGDTVIIPTEFVTENIMLGFDEGLQTPILEWFRLMTERDFKKADVVDDLVIKVNDKIVEFRDIMPVTCCTPNNDKFKVGVGCDYTTIEL